jgi:hypothetical protein
LVDGSVVAVAGSGYPPVDDFDDQFAVVDLWICRVPVVTIDDDCDWGQGTELFLEGTDSFDESLVLSPILDLGGGTEDCRVTACALLATPLSFTAAAEYEPSEAGLVELGFDPNAPLRPPPVLDVDPDTDLVDGDVVDLSGSGFTAEGAAFVFQCVAGATDPIEGCNLGTYFFAPTDATGSFTGAAPVSTVFETDIGDSPVDCRVDLCVMVAVEGDPFSSRRSVEVPLGFDPDGPLLDPTIAVSPSTGLEGGDVVSVAGAGWPVSSAFVVYQCVVGAELSRNHEDPCDFNHAVVYVPRDDGGFGPLPLAPDEATAPPTDLEVLRDRALPLPRTSAEATQAFDVDFEVHAAYGGRGANRFDCRLVACELVVGSLSRRLDRRAPLAFAVGAPSPVAGSPAFAG